ncbi:mannosyltransferase putative-domain-containing protein [Scheffersomyces amazonensis]|uniref:mannosyltransferase putative-domain-containing protein n=1 Tax=Scheffersomyces amazonensis TaxID=1078765 RepID=UPI00315D86E2
MVVSKHLRRNRARLFLAVASVSILLILSFTYQSVDSNEYSVIDTDTIKEHPVPPPKPQVPLDFPPAVEEIAPHSPKQPKGKTNRPQSNKIKKPTPDQLKTIRDYTVFFDKLEDFAIHAESIKDKYTTDKAKELFSSSDDFLFSKQYLENVLDIPQDTFDKLKNSHTRYVEQRIPDLVDKLGFSTFGNILESDKEWNEYQGSAGYVLVGGGRYSWLSYLVIRQIRASGGKLPIELFIPTKSDYDEEFCEKVLPKLNARCNVFDTNLANNLAARFKIGGYQYKMLALISSKFENVLYLDSDNFPTKNVEYLFESKQYKDSHLLLWPDAWARTTNPKFFEIAGVEVKENKLRYSAYDKKQAQLADKPLDPLSSYTFENSNFHDFEGSLPDPTSETGMLVINKTTHLKTLLLCLYYNVFGPDFYYPIMTQGSAGEGDKESFIAAAHVLGNRYFQTAKQFRWTGYVSEADGKFTSKALGHFDPAYDEQSGKEADIIFMHLSYPKYYPNWLVDNHDLVYEKSGKHIRMYADINDNVGYDFDLRVLQFFTQGLCPNYFNEEGLAVDGTEGPRKSKDFMGPFLPYVGSDDEINSKRCEEVFIPHLKWLKETTQFPDNSVIV